MTNYSEVTQEDRKKWGQLTQAERLYLQLIADGSSNVEVAKVVERHPQTVSNTLQKVYQKLGVHTRTEAVLWAVQRGYIETEVG